MNIYIASAGKYVCIIEYRIFTPLVFTVPLLQISIERLSAAGNISSARAGKYAFCIVCTSTEIQYVHIAMTARNRTFPVTKVSEYRGEPVL